MDSPDLCAVEKILKKKYIAKTAFQHVHIDILKSSCKYLKLEVTCSGKRSNASIRSDYEAALVKYVCNYSP